MRTVRDTVMQVSVSSDSEGRGAGGVARGPQCPLPQVGCSVPKAWMPRGWAPAWPTAEWPGASSPALGFGRLRPEAWLSQGSRMCPLIHKGSPRSTTPRQRPRAGKLAETGSQGPGAALGSQRPGLGAVTPGRPPVQCVSCWAAWRGPRRELGQRVPAASPPSPPPPPPWSPPELC